MAEAKKTTAKGTVKAGRVSTAEKKEAARAVVKETAAKTAEKAAAAKTAVKSTAKKAAKAASRKPSARAAKADAVKESVSIQFAGKDYTTAALVKIARDVWQYDLKKDPADFREVQLYVKPEESRVYYVINESESGSFEI